MLLGLLLTVMFQSGDCGRVAADEEMLRCLPAEVLSIHQLSCNTTQTTTSHRRHTFGAPADLDVGECADIAPRTTDPCSGDELVSPE